MTIDRKHIDKVFEQKFSFSDQRKFVRYLENEQLNEETKLIVEEQWTHFIPDRDELPNLDPVFYKLYYAISSQKGIGFGVRSLFVRVSQVAAILLAGIFIAGSIYFSNSTREITSELPIQFISQTGFRNQFKLPDGTTGWLGYGTQMKYHIDENNKRVVDLDGLAYFDVARREKQSFVVNTPAKLNIEVLGTRFNVSSYSKDNSCEVVLERGKVRLNVNEQKVGEMAPSERVVYDSGKNTMEKSTVDVADFVAWKDGKLILRDVSLEETCQKLGRYYNVDFELQTDKNDKQKVRLLLENETLDDALKLLTMIVPVKIQVEERRILGNDSYSRKKIILKNK